jgi:hypothetical protein
MEVVEIHLAERTRGLRLRGTHRGVHAECALEDDRRHGAVRAAPAAQFP